MTVITFFSSPLLRSLLKKTEISPSRRRGASSSITAFGGHGVYTSPMPKDGRMRREFFKKVNIDGEKIISKRSRKKKSLAELKDEESSLLKERRELKREMAALRMNLERQRATNEKLKRMEIECAESTSESISNQSTACDPSTSLKQPSKNADAASHSEFFLPDLNIPFDEARAEA